MFIDSLPIEIYSNFNLDMERFYWSKDQNMINHIDTFITTQHERIIPTKFKGIYESCFNPTLWVSSTLSYKEFPDYLEFSKPLDKRNRKLAEFAYQGYSPYWSTPWEEIQAMTSKQLKELRKQSRTKYFFNSFGVCDSIEQIASYTKFLKDLEKTYIVFVAEVRKEDQPSSGGWRWHKWGQYLGKHKPSCEYLADEPFIEKVYTFKIVEVTENKTAPDYSSDCLDFFSRGRSLIVKDKQGKYITSIEMTSSEEKLVCFFGREDRDFKPFSTYDSHYSNHIDDIIIDVTSLYKEYLEQGVKVFDKYKIRDNQ